MRAESNNRKIVTIGRVFIFFVGDVLSAVAVVEAKAPYYLIHDREVTSLCRRGCPQESSNERENFETLILLILGDVSRDACYSLLA